MVFVTRQLKFSSAHRLYNPEYTFDKNEDIYDKCNNYHGHGHNYTLEVTVAGKPDPQTGYVIDLKKLKKIMNDEVVSKVDHKHLNFDVEFLRGIIPTVENLVYVFWQILEPKITDGKLYKIKLYETDTSYVEYYGEDFEVRKFKMESDK
jgi:6-pyruvoyltetrahydropterin/6-carboxytetrahydropterin synthase